MFSDLELIKVKLFTGRSSAAAAVFGSCRDSNPVLHQLVVAEAPEVDHGDITSPHSTHKAHTQYDCS